MASIMPFDSFLRTSLPKKLFKSYRSLEILSEADLQAYVWMHSTRFLRRLPGGASKFIVQNKFYLQDLKIHPDLVVLRFGKPWICLELKEAGRIVPKAIGEDWKRLNKTRRKLKAHRGYLIYLVRHSGRHFPKPRHFSEIKDRRSCLFPIVVSVADQLSAEEFTAWNARFKRCSKYRLPPKRGKGAGSQRWATRANLVRDPRFHG